MSKESVAFLIMIVSFITGLVTMFLLIAYGLSPSKTDLILWRLWAVLILIEIPFLISLFYTMKRTSQGPKIKHLFMQKPIIKKSFNERYADHCDLLKMQNPKLKSVCSYEEWLEIVLFQTENSIPNDWYELKRQSVPLSEDLLSKCSKLVKNVDIGDLD